MAGVLDGFCFTDCAAPETPPKEKEGAAVPKVDNLVPLNVIYINQEYTLPNGTKVKYLNEKGLPVELNAEGFLAIILQHEIDHLNGKVFIERVQPKDQAKMQAELL